MYDIEFDQNVLRILNKYYCDQSTGGSGGTGAIGPISRRHAAQYYIHKQCDPDSVWKVHHNFRQKYVQVQVCDLTNKVVQPKEIVFINNNLVNIYFGIETVGIATVIAGPPIHELYLEEDPDLFKYTGGTGGLGITGGTGGTGCRGEIGPKGVMGPQGFPGPTGARGRDGRDGCPGPPGPQGPKGDPGPQGPRGCDGRDGRDGVDGINGLNGINGHDGQQGPKGDIGPIGPPGPQGPQGDLPDGLTVDDIRNLMSSVQNLENCLSQVRYDLKVLMYFIKSLLTGTRVIPTFSTLTDELVCSLDRLEFFMGGSLIPECSKCTSIDNIIISPSDDDNNNDDDIPDGTPGDADDPFISWSNINKNYTIPLNSQDLEKLKSGENILKFTDLSV